MSIILLADDDPFAREALSHFLRRQGYEVLLAEDGKEAIQLFLDHQPDLVLLDAIMPGLDGFETCRLMKQHDAERMTPILMVTGREDDSSIDTAFAAGAEEFITKPIRWSVMRQRLKLLLRTRQAENERRQHLEKLTFERSLVEEVIRKMRASPRFEPTHLRTLITPVESTNGDLLLAAFRPDGVQHVMVGDFTGHGLPAAIGSPIVSDIFYAMTGKGFSLRDIVVEINHKLLAKTPPSMFLAAGFAEIDRAAAVAHLWNCSLPGIVVVREGRVKARFFSDHMPMGVTDRPFSHGVKMNLERGDRIFLLSDGVVEEKNPSGELFGEERAETLFCRIVAESLPLETLREALAAHRGNGVQLDDMTVVEVAC